MSIDLSHYSTPQLKAMLALLKTAQGGWLGRLKAWWAESEIEYELRQRGWKPTDQHFGEQK